MNFTDEERAVFAWHDGERERRADPLELRLALLEACGGDVDGLARSCKPEGEPPLPEEVLRAAQAEKRLADVVRGAFSLAPFDEATGGGCTTSMVRAVWLHYCEWLAKKGGAGGGSPAS